MDYKVAFRKTMWNLSVENDNLFKQIEQRTMELADQESIVENKIDTVIGSLEKRF